MRRIRGEGRVANREWRVASGLCEENNLTAETQKNNKIKKSLRARRLCGKKQFNRSVTQPYTFWHLSSKKHKQVGFLQQNYTKRQLFV